MFGPNDAFLTTILKLLRQLPIYPMFGRGRTRLQPAYVKDVAEAVARVIGRADIRLCVDWDKQTMHRDMKNTSGEWYKVSDD